MILGDVIENTNVKKDIIEGKSIFDDFIIIKRNIT